jgi:hypothetical protein
VTVVAETLAATAERKLQTLSVDGTAVEGQGELFFALRPGDIGNRGHQHIAVGMRQHLGAGGRHTLQPFADVVVVAGQAQ